MKRIIAGALAALLAFASPALADNYTATGGTGLTFAAKNIAGVLYPWWIPANSAGVELFTSGNAAYVQATAWPLPLGASTAALQGTNSATTAHTCSVAGYSEIGCLGQLDDDVKGPITGGAAPIGIAMPNAATNLVKGTTAAMTGTSSTQVIGAVGGKVIYVTHVSCVNSHATVGTFVTLQDGSGGTALTTLAAASVFGGDEQVGTTPLFWTTSGNGLYAADVTTGANVICNASGYAQ